MSDKMLPLSFNRLLHWIIDEYTSHETIFNIPKEKFVINKNTQSFKIFDEAFDFPIGPAAGPHTQLTQNIITSYLCGGRFFELKTVQIMDELGIDKPCIYAAEEGYNVEWSQELKLYQSLDEYIKAWILLHFIKEIFSPSENSGFIFNMSVGYDLKGIKSPQINSFIDNLIDANNNELFYNYKTQLLDFIESEKFELFASQNKLDLSAIVQNIKDISPNVSNSVTLSTMHGCPPQDIETIAQYLIEHKGLHTFVKLNPTLLGFKTVEKIINDHGYNHIKLKKESFDHDMQFKDCIPMVKRLITFSNKFEKTFGIKLSNTLGVSNTGENLPGNEMYMSGKALFPLTINLAKKIKEHIKEEIPISYSGGASIYNIKDILETGISPVTFATDLLKPGGYLRLTQIANKIKDLNISDLQQIQIDNLNNLADSSLNDKFYSMEEEFPKEINLQKELPLFDCYIAPCEVACPIHQDITSYIHEIKNGNYDKALEIILEKNPLPNITGYICDHQCMHSCTRLNYDHPVQIRELKKIAAEKSLDDYISNMDEKNGTSHEKVAIIGAGPSGLAAAYFLARKGVKVTIFEKTDKAGGTVIHTIPSFRIPQAAIEKDVEFLKKFRVEFIFNSDPEFDVKALFNKGFEYIYLSIGAGVSQSLDLGYNEKVYDAINFLKDFNKNNKYSLGKSVAIVGGGNSAMDAARAATRVDGVENVSIIYRRTKENMPADMEEFYNALDDGVIFKELSQPIRFEEEKLICQKMQLSEIGSDGRRKVKAIEDQFVELDIDSVITAIGEKVDLGLLSKNGLVEEENIKINSETLESPFENVFIGGDAQRGPATVVEAIADARKVADTILKRLNISNDDQKFEITGYHEKVSNIQGYVETNLPEQAIDMANQCLTCNHNCNKCVEVCPNRANVMIKSPNGLFKDDYQIIHIDQLCNECGNCTTFCPYDSSPYKDKFTFFNSKIEFLKSKNNGVLVNLNKDNLPESVLLRKNNLIEEFKFDSDFINSNRKEIQIIREIISNYNYLIQN